MRRAALLAALVAAPAFAQDAPPFDQAWEATLAALSGEMDAATTDQTDGVIFSTYPMQSGGELVCETASPDAPETMLRGLSEGLTDEEAPAAAITRCIAPLGRAVPPDAAAFTQACTSFLEGLDLRADPYAPSEAVSGASATAAEDIEGGTVARIACEVTPAGDMDMTVHVTGEAR